MALPIAPPHLRVWATLRDHPEISRDQPRSAEVSRDQPSARLCRTAEANALHRARGLSQQKFLPEQGTHGGGLTGGRLTGGARARQRRAALPGCGSLVSETFTALFRLLTPREGGK